MKNGINTQSLFLAALLAIFAIQLSIELTPREAAANSGAFVNHFQPADPWRG